MELAPGDIVLLRDGQEVEVTDVADEPETLFVYVVKDGNPCDMRVTDRSEVVRNISEENRSAA